MHPILILAIAIATVFLLIIRLRINAFVALISAAVLIGLLSPEVPLTDVMKEVGERFGGVVGRIGIAIAMAAIIGQCLMESGAADRITRRFVAWLGDRLSSLSLVASGYVLSVPVFFDTVFYLLVPLARAMSVRMGGKNYVLYILAISAGGSVTHVFVPPTPGPLVMASTLGVDVGIVILVGLCVALPASLCGWLYAIWIDRKLDIPVREAPGLSLDEFRQEFEYLIGAEPPQLRLDLQKGFVPDEEAPPADAHIRVMLSVSYAAGPARVLVNGQLMGQAAYVGDFV